MRWWIRYGTNAPVEVDLSSAPDVKTHVQTLVSKFGIQEDPDRFAIMVADTYRYLDDADLKPGAPRVDTGVSQVVLLVLKPEFEAEAHTEILRTGTLAEKKKTIFALGKNYLRNEAFVDAFIKCKGLQQIYKLCRDTTGATLAFALNCVELTLSTSKETGRASRMEDMVLLVSLVDNTNLSVSKATLKALTQVIRKGTAEVFDQMQRALASEAFRQGKEPYGSLLQALESQDVDICVFTLRVLNALLDKADGQISRLRIFQILQDLGGNYAIQKLVVVGSEDILTELREFQRHKLRTYQEESQTQYDKNNPEHEEHLLLLWTTVFPNVKLENRVGEQWKIMGFQGTDPCTDFRGMGICGLNNLLYFAENHTELFRRYCKEQQDRGAALYPVATAGINVSQLMFQIFGLMGKAEDTVLYPLLFDVEYDHPFEEAYSIIFQLFDHVWNSTNASYMDFPRVINEVKEKVLCIIKNCNSIEQFQKAMAMEMTNTTASRRTCSENVDSTDFIYLKKSVAADVTQMVREQKLAILRDGQHFSVLTSIKDKKLALGAGRQRYIFTDDSNKILFWYDQGEKGPQVDTMSLREMSVQVEVKDITKIVTNGECPTLQQHKGKIKGDTISNCTIGVFFRNGECLEFVADNSVCFNNWVAGLQALIGGQFISPFVSNEINTLVDFEVKLRTFDLEDFLEVMGRDAPQRPPVPDNYFFAMEDNETIMKTADGSIPDPPKRNTKSVRRLGATTPSRSEQTSASNVGFSRHRREK